MADNHLSDHQSLSSLLCINSRSSALNSRSAKIFVSTGCDCFQFPASDSASRSLLSLIGRVRRQLRQLVVDGMGARPPVDGPSASLAPRPSGDPAAMVESWTETRGGSRSDEC